MLPMLYLPGNSVSKYLFYEFENVISRNMVWWNAIKRAVNKVT